MQPSYAILSQVEESGPRNILMAFALCNELRLESAQFKVTMASFGEQVPITIHILKRC